MSRLEFSWATSQSCFHLVDVNIKNYAFRPAAGELSSHFLPLQTPYLSKSQRNHFSYKNCVEIKKECRTHGPQEVPAPEQTVSWGCEGWGVGRADLEFTKKGACV